MNLQKSIFQTFFSMDSSSAFLTKVIFPNESASVAFAAPLRTVARVGGRASLAFQTKRSRIHNCKHGRVNLGREKKLEKN